MVRLMIPLRSGCRTLPGYSPAMGRVIISSSQINRCRAARLKNNEFYKYESEVFSR